ncbi:MAG: TetR/AcrR family transcriptional regulator [Archangiaceae bacterium]|nr:TetR/AcrR family transcriptional regulator [Archangiaceae bacterium]
MKKRKPLTRALILEKAMKLLDDEGLEGLSMRRLASALKVEAMSLYHHVTDKQDLLSALADLALSTIPPPDLTKPWRQRAEGIAVGLYQALLAHPALVGVLAAETAQPRDARVLLGLDQLIGALAEAGLSPTHQVSAQRSMIAFCFGFVLTHTRGLVETREQAQETWDQYDPNQFPAEHFPHLAALGVEFVRTKAEDDFRFLVQAWLDAVERAGASRPG